MRSMPIFIQRVHLGGKGDGVSRAQIYAPAESLESPLEPRDGGLGSLGFNLRLRKEAIFGTFGSCSSQLGALRARANAST